MSVEISGLATRAPLAKFMTALHAHAESSSARQSHDLFAASFGTGKDNGF